MKQLLSPFLILSASVSFAGETRQLDAHVHGVSTLDIAIDGSTVLMELHAPGADIVGFEHAATSAEDRDAVAAAVATLARPLDLFVVPTAAGCTVTQASASLDIEDTDDGHDYSGHDHDDHGHDDHGHNEHAHDDHGHDDHGHAENAAHDDHGHEDHDHDTPADGATHSEFHAKYTVNCAEPSELTEITFAFFDAFENAQEVEVQVVSATGAQAFEVTRAAPSLGLANLF